MSSLNRAELIGNLTKEPEVRSLQDGGKVANLSVATNEKWKKDGETQERVEYHRVTIFGPLAGVAEQYLKKGSKVFLEGQLQTRKWEKEGQTHYTTEIVLQKFGGRMIMLDKPQGSGSQQDGGAVPF